MRRFLIAFVAIACCLIASPLALASEGSLPDVTLYDIDGTTATMSRTYGGTKRLIIVGRPGCGYCQAMVRSIEACASDARYGDVNFLILDVDSDRNAFVEGFASRETQRIRFFSPPAGSGVSYNSYAWDIYGYGQGSVSLPFVFVAGENNQILYKGAGVTSADGLLEEYFGGGIPREGVSGTCSWSVSDNGVLTVRPTTGSTGRLDSDAWMDVADVPWARLVDKITEVRFEGTVVAPDTYAMFYGCKNLTKVNLTGLDTSPATYMSYMFAYCSSLRTVDVSRLNTSSVYYMSGMFEGCSSLASLDASRWDTSSLVGVSGMFWGCSSLASLDVTGWNTSTLAYMDDMFTGCTSLASFKVGSHYYLRSSSMIPEPANEGGKWWSAADGNWCTPSEILSNRSGIADTYLSEAVPEPDYSHDGWVTLAGGRKGYAKGGKLVKGWLTLGDDKYWFSSTGRAATGWTEIDNQTYYFREDGTCRMARGWATVEGDKYLFRADGRLGDGWVSWDGAKYYADSGLPRSGWQTIDGTEYYFREDGTYRMALGWATIGSEKRLFRTDGRLADGWVTLDKANYYADAGVPREGWQDIKGSGRRYFRPAPDYRMATGWATIGGKAVQFDSQGRQIS